MLTQFGVNSPLHLCSQPRYNIGTFQVNSSSVNKVVHTFSYLKKIYINKPPFRDVHYPIVCQKPTFSTAKAAIFTAVQQCTAGQYSVQIVTDSMSSATAWGSIQVRLDGAKAVGTQAMSHKGGWVSYTPLCASTSRLHASQHNIQIMRFNIIYFSLWEKWCYEKNELKLNKSYY